MKNSFQNIQPKQNTGKYFRFRILGKGPTLLILGGSSSDWENTLELLASNYTLVIPTFSKAVLDRQLKEDDPINYIQRLLDELRIERFSILAHSVSSWIGLSLVAKYPSRIHKLILANLPSAIEDKSGFVRLHQELIGKKGILKPELSAFWYDRIFCQLGFLNELKEVLKSTPFLLIAGETDRFFSEEKLINWSNLEKANLNLEVIRYAGHFSMKDNPWYFSAIVKEFLHSKDTPFLKSRMA
ncbi:pimeloyl-ACP methyl ester carboxylesterase [Algoriphagus sp. 4150]|uniref:alpha/beta fold hydrolase n=1 Tax=Algoriphagus sp. 4150 TaxID=2817756 RepID=UPI00285A9AE7|nr:alpha/beta hydrolase [Algoriphagus sp. 4150]MDR7132529.1 pimeloyl-ACP methyl ester carboxylesterase [Algoriphagus sp. 4150]